MDAVDVVETTKTRQRKRQIATIDLRLADISERTIEIILNISPSSIGHPLYIMSAIASTSVLPLSRRVAGPHRLPHLLSILPSAGRLALVRPTDGDPESFYLITRSHLRFTAKEVQEEKAKKKKQAITMGGGGNAEEKPKLKVVNVNPMDGGVIKAHGRAHGMLFRHGEYDQVRPPQPMQSHPDLQRLMSSDSIIRQIWCSLYPHQDARPPHPRPRQPILDLHRPVYPPRIYITNCKFMERAIRSTLRGP